MTGKVAGSAKAERRERTHSRLGSTSDWARSGESQCDKGEAGQQWKATYEAEADLENRALLSLRETFWGAEKKLDFLL